MSAVEDWLKERRPPPPGALAPALGGTEAPGADPREVLLDRAVHALERARATPGTVRESAFHLLAADALLTYACEAALEAAEPSHALSEVLRRAAASRA